MLFVAKQERGGGRGPTPRSILHQCLPLADLAQRDHASARGDGKTGVAFNADRLQRDRAIEAADQYVGAEAHAHGGLRRRAAVIALKAAAAHVRRRRYDAPYEHGVTGVTNVDSIARKFAGVVLISAVDRVEHAMHLTARR